MIKYIRSIGRNSHAGRKDHGMTKEQITTPLQNRLLEHSDPGYLVFQRKLIPTVDPEKIIGVRTPILRGIAREMRNTPAAGRFLRSLPHCYFEENQLHAFLLSDFTSYEQCIAEVSSFLPYVDNWATCDQMSPKVFGKHRKELLDPIRSWLASDHTYTVRFAIGMLMQHYLDRDFDLVYPEMVASVHSGEYYIRMMVAWYFATALAKQYDAVLPYLTERKLDPWTHNKTIQKSIESFRISPEQKSEVKSLRIHISSAEGKK